MVSLFPLCPEGLLQNYRTTRFALETNCEDFVTDHEGLIFRAFVSYCENLLNLFYPLGCLQIPFCLVAGELKVFLAVIV